MSWNFQVQQSGLELHVIPHSLFPRNLYSKGSKIRLETSLLHHRHCYFNLSIWMEKPKRNQSSKFHRTSKEKVKRFQSQVYMPSEPIASIQTLMGPSKSSPLFRFFELLLTDLRTTSIRFFKWSHSLTSAHTKKQYKKLALLLHPNKNLYFNFDETFKHVGKVYYFLSDKVRKKKRG